MKGLGWWWEKKRDLICCHSHLIILLICHFPPIIGTSSNIIRGTGQKYGQKTKPNWAGDEETCHVKIIDVFLMWYVFLASYISAVHILVTGTELDPEGVVTELKTMPQIRSTQTEGVPVWSVGSLLFVAHGMVIQSVEHAVPTLLPSAGVPPVMLKAMPGVLTEKEDQVSSSTILLNRTYLNLCMPCIGFHKSSSPSWRKSSSRYWTAVIR